MGKRTKQPTPEATGAGGRLAEALAQAQHFAALAAQREPTSKVLGVRLPAKLYGQLVKAAESRGLTVAELARVILAAGLDDIRGGRRG